MPYQLEWLVPDYVVELKAMGNVTLDEARNHAQSIISILSQSQHRLHFLIDLSGVIPGDFPLEALHDLADYDHTNVGWVVVVVKNRIVSMISAIDMRMRQINFKQFSNRQDAIAFLKRRDTVSARKL